MGKRAKTLTAITAIALTLALCGGTALTLDREAQAKSRTPAPEAPAIEAIPPATAPPLAVDPPEETDAQADAPAELWANDEGRKNLKLLAVDLEAESQWAIYDLCGDSGLFCLVMAIADNETHFDPCAIGDGGGSFGIFQINVKWHLDRMERLGVTDLTDPVQCAAVAIDYLLELEDRYGFAPLSHEHLMSYNMGPGNARKAINNGTTSTAYSREVMTVYQGYLEELEATP